MQTKVEFEYSVGDCVVVTAIGMDGFVDALSIDNNGKQYRVVYWNDGDRHSMWLYAREINGKR